MSDFDIVLFDEGESPILTIRKHWFIYVRDSATTLVVGILPFVVWQILAALGAIPAAHIAGALGRYLGLLWLLAAWIALFVLWTDYYLDLWIVTDRRIFNIQQIGLFRRQASSCELDNVQEVVVKTDNFLQTLFHYGTIEIQTAGPTSEYIEAEGIPHPERVRVAIQESRSRVGHLEEQTKKQEQLLHMVAHEVKGYLSKNAAVLASIVEGDFGSVPDPLKNTATSALSDTRTGVGNVMDILQGSNLKTGAVSIVAKPFDLRAALRAVIDAEQPLASQKGLALSLVADARLYLVNGDESKIKNDVLRNLVENAIRYTPQGSVMAGITAVDENVVVWVEDSGVGITPEDMQKLFTEGGHGAQSRAVNPSSTGFGLFIAKQIVEAHGGHIWAESDGAGKGSRFFLVLPLSGAAKTS